MTSVQCRLLNFILKTIIKPKALQLASTTSLTEQIHLIHKARKQMHRWAISPPATAVIKEESIHSVPCVWVTDHKQPFNRTMLYVHGGGYAVGEPRHYFDMSYRLGIASRARVLLIDYRLVPEHPLDAALADVLSVYQSFLARGMDPQQLYMAGDSAGGGLTLAALVALRNKKLALPKAAICFSPWTDLAATGASIKNNYHHDPYVVLPNDLSFLGKINKYDPHVSPLYAELKGLPPLLIQVGENEVLLDDARAFAMKAKAAGVTVNLQIWKDVPHVWQLFAKYLPEGRQALLAAGEFVNAL